MLSLISTDRLKSFFKSNAYYKKQKKVENDETNRSCIVGWIILVITQRTDTHIYHRRILFVFNDCRSKNKNVMFERLKQINANSYCRNKNKNTRLLIVSLSILHHPLYTIVKQFVAIMIIFVHNNNLKYNPHINVFIVD